MSSKLKRYIEQQPQEPEGFRYKTPILVSDSKGFTLRDACNRYEFPLESWCFAGAKTEVLVNLIESRIEKALKRHQYIIIYLWAGTCDLTEKRGKFINLRHHSNKSVNNIVEQYNRALKLVRKYKGAEIKFIDCPILSIVKWNKSRNHQNPAKYKSEDFQVTRQVKLLNSKILELNKSIGKNTIKISQYFFRGRKVKRGGVRKSVRITINKKDGVHPGALFSLVITKHLLIDTYLECYHIRQQSDIIQLHVEEEELLNFF